MPNTNSNIILDPVDVATAPVTVSSNTEITGPLSAFGEVLMVESIPRLQLDAVYGLLSTDTETLTTLSGAAGAANGLFTVSTGTTANAYGRLWSKRFVRHAGGQSSRFRFTAMFTTGVPNSEQLAGPMTESQGFLFGYEGAQFGILRRTGGAAHIARLTVTTGSSGAGNITVTLNGTAFIVPVSGVLSTTAVAELIAESGVFTGWTGIVSPQSNGTAVTFIQSIPATAGGAFSVSGAGVTGTFSTVQAGAPIDTVTNFIPKSAWNVDRLDGSLGPMNPSGMLLDPTKLNVYEVLFPYLGAGTISFLVMTPTGQFVVVHRIQYPNANTIASQRNPTMRVGWFVSSSGSTTNLTLSGASAAGFVDGPLSAIRNPFAHNGAYTSTETEHVAFALRVRGEFGGIVNMREMLPKFLTAAVETANRIVRVRIYINPTLTGTMNWSYVDQTISGMEVASPTNLTPTGGTLTAAAVVSTGAPLTMNLNELDLRLSPGDVLAISLTTVSNTTSAAVSLNWEEK